MQQWKTIITYLTTGNPNGIKTVEFSNRLIKWISIPRKDFKEAIEKRTELKYSGIYFLIWENEKWDNSCYIGQAKNLTTRIQQHSKDTDKDFRNLAICFTYKDGSLNESDINYLEKELIQFAKNADRYKIINNTSWNYWLIPEHRISDMIEFIEDAKILITNLWHPLLTEIINKTKEDQINDTYYLTARWSDAKGIYTEEGFVVLRGSKWPKDMVKSTIENQYYAFRNRPKLIEKEILKEEGEYVYFLKDHTFNSPSAASDVVSWRSSNGRTLWKNKEWKTLDEVIRQTAESIT